MSLDQGTWELPRGDGDVLTLDATCEKYDAEIADVFHAPAATDAEQRLRHCAERPADYTEPVFQALHQM